MKPTVVIIDCNRNGLAAIRSLGEAGVDVVAVDHYKRNPGQYSKYVRSRHILTKPDLNEQTFIHELEELGKALSEKNKLYLLPVNDEYVRTLAKNWHVLSPYFTPLFEINEEMLENITNKLKFSDYCETIGIKQPAKYRKEDILENRVSYPIIFKPDERRSLENISQKVFKVQVCHSREEAEKFLNYLSDAGIEVIIQQFIPGGDDELYTGGVAAFKGRLVGCFTGKKVRQFPPSAGQASFAKGVESEMVVEYSEKIVRELGFTGIAQIEYKHHDGEFYVIEMNPRSWSWHGLAKSTGVDLPLLVFNAARGKTSTDVKRNLKNGLTWHYFIEDLIYNVILNQNISFYDLLKSAFNSKSHAFFNRSDLLPWFAHLGFQFPMRLAQLVVKRK